MDIRVCVVIPCFDNGRTISEAVKEVLLQTPYPVLIIDDGSPNPVNGDLYSWEVRQGLESGRVRVVRFERNRGKGAALQFAATDLLRDEFTHMFTFDADGRHRASEIENLLAVARKHPWDLVLGDRTVGRVKAPRGGWRGKLSDFLVQYETGVKVRDARSGFRVYPLFGLQTLRFFTRHYDWELEVLIRLMWRGVGVREVSIETNEPSNLQSHFNRFSDNLRISLLNTAMVAISMLRTHRSPSRLATALALGVFIGCSPFYGFHWILAFCLSIVLRLNVIMVWMGTHVSNPLIAPAVLMSELWIGRHWLHLAPENGAKGDFIQLLGGATVLGVTLSFSAYVTAFLVGRSMQRPAVPGGLRFPIRAGLWFIRRRWLTGFRGIFTAGLAAFWWLTAWRARGGLNEYWKRLEPNSTWRKKQARIFRQFRFFAEARLEALALASTAAPHLKARVHGPEQVENILNANSSATILSAHHGAFEVAAAGAGLGPRLHRWPVRRPDWTGGHPELVPFCDGLAAFDLGVFQNDNLICGFGFKSDDGVYEFFLRPLKAKENTPRGRAIAYARELEHFVRLYPEQWNNFFPFWSKIPAAVATAQIKIPSS